LRSAGGVFLGAVRWVFSTLRQNTGLMVIGILLSFANGACNIVNPILFKQVIDDVIMGGQDEKLLPLCIWMIVIGLLHCATAYLSQVCLETGSQKTVRDLRNQLYEKLQRLDQNFYGDNRTGDLMMKLTGDMDWIRHFSNFLIPQTVTNVVFFISVLTVFMIFNWALALMALCLTPFTILLTIQVRKHMRPVHDKVRAQSAQLNTLVQENISGNRVVKAFVRETYELDRFEKENQGFKDASINTTRTWQRYGPFLDGFSSMLSIVLLLFGGIFCINGNMTIGTLNIFLSLTWGL